MKRAKEPSICRVKIFRPSKLPVQELRTYEVKIYGRKIKVKNRELSKIIL